VVRSVVGQSVVGQSVVDRFSGVQIWAGQIEGARSGAGAVRRILVDHLGGAGANREVQSAAGRICLVVRICGAGRNGLADVAGARV